MPLPAVSCRPEQTIVKMEMAQICHCEGALRPWQSREGTDDLYRPPLKWYVPIASVAALSERHGQLQIWRHSRRMCNASKFVIARPQRGRGNLGKAVTFSPMAFLQFGNDLRDCHVGLRPPRNDNSGEREVHQRPSAVEWPYTRRSLSAATDAIGWYVFIASLFGSAALRRERHAAPLQWHVRLSIMPPNLWPLLLAFPMICPACIPGNAGKLSLWEGSQNVQKKLPFGY